MSVVPAFIRRHPVVAFAVVVALVLLAGYFAFIAPRLAAAGAVLAMAGGAAGARRRVVQVEPEEIHAAAEVHREAVPQAKAADAAADARVVEVAAAAGDDAREAVATEPVSAPRPRSKYLQGRP